MSTSLKKSGKMEALPGNPSTARRHWSLLLALAAMLVLLSAGWNLWLLHTGSKGETIGNVVLPEAEGDVSSASVRAVFEARRVEEQRYRQEYRFVDPSL